MCLILFAHRVHPDFPLVVAANRDEWFERPSAPARFWADTPTLIAGRDLLQGGTWLGLSDSGRFAALTNFRDPPAHRADAPSRGHLVRDYLVGRDDPEDYIAGFAPHAKRFNGFNLLVGTPEHLVYFSNRNGADAVLLEPGIYGLSNHFLDTDWHKVRVGKAALQTLLREPLPQFMKMFEVLGDTTPASDTDLPSTGVPIERERALSPAHIRAGDYGTRCATVIAIDRDGTALFAERSFDREGVVTGTMSETFRRNPTPIASRHAGSRLP
jgi:uncharacterized protein with NRDE domain